MLAHAAVFARKARGFARRDLGRGLMRQNAATLTRVRGKTSGKKLGQHIETSLKGSHHEAT
jgi:hypothetical protein